MSMRNFLVILFAVWIAAYLASFIVPAMSEPTGDGFTRGLNRVTTFFGWQIIAGALGALIWILARSEDLSMPMRWLFRLPAILAGGLIIFVVGIVLIAIVRDPPTTSYTPPGPVAPAAEPVKPNE